MKRTGGEAVLRASAVWTERVAARAWRRRGQAEEAQDQAPGPGPGPEPGAWTAPVRWQAKNVLVNFSSPVAVGGHVYGLGPEKNLFCVDARSGALKWSQAGFSVQAAEKSHLALIVVGQNLLALTEAGELVLVAADPAGYRELGRVQACGSNWCNPAYADGRLYLRDAKELACLQLAP